MSVYCMIINLWIPAGALAVLMILFICIGILNGSQVELNEKEVCRKILNLKLYSIPKRDLKEVGVAGLNVLGDKKKTGMRYIYFSADKMDDNTRFQMCLKWPPKDKVYMLWNESRYAKTQEYWDNEIVEYNAGELGV